MTNDDAIKILTQQKDKIINDLESELRLLQDTLFKSNKKKIELEKENESLKKEIEELKNKLI